MGTGDDPDKYSKYWTLDEVLRAMDQGDTFYTKGETSGKVARTEKILCSSCQRMYVIRSTPDAVKDNNLDSLRKCRSPE